MRRCMTLMLPILALLVGELFLRHYHQRTARRALPMELRAETRALSWDQIKDQYRIVCLGDSITYGEDMPAQQAFPAVLGTLLSGASHGSPVVVVNSGIRGNTAVQGLERVARDVLWYKPHVVIIAFGWNDGRLGYWPLDPLRERQMLGPHTLVEKLDTLLRHSHLWLTLRARARRVLRRLGWKGGQALAEPNGVPEPRVSRAGFEQALSRLVQLIRESGCPYVVLLTTTPFSQDFVQQMDPQWRERQMAVYSDYNQVTRSVAAQHHTVLVDLHADFSSADLAALLAEDGIHLTPEGERRIALRVHEALWHEGLTGQGR